MPGALSGHPAGLSIMCDKTNLDVLREIVPNLIDISQPSNGYSLYEGDKGAVFGLGLAKKAGIAVQDVYVPPGVVFPEHKHSSTEFILCYEGKITLNVESKETVLESGDGIRIKPNQPHSFYSVTGCWVMCATIPADESYPSAAFH